MGRKLCFWDEHSWKGEIERTFRDTEHCKDLWIKSKSSRSNLTLVEFISVVIYKGNWLKRCTLRSIWFWFFQRSLFCLKNYWCGRRPAGTIPTWDFRTDFFLLLAPIVICRLNPNRYEWICHGVIRLQKTMEPKTMELFCWAQKPWNF